MSDQGYIWIVKVNSSESLGSNQRFTRSSR